MTVQLEIEIRSLYYIYDIKVFTDFLEDYDVNIIHSIKFNEGSYDFIYNESFELTDIKDSYGYSIFETGYFFNNLIPNNVKDNSYIIQYTSDYDELTQLVFELEHNEKLEYTFEVKGWNDKLNDFYPKDEKCTIEHIGTWIIIED